MGAGDPSPIGRKEGRETPGMSDPWHAGAAVPFLTREDARGNRSVSVAAPCRRALSCRTSHGLSGRDAHVGAEACWDTLRMPGWAFSPWWRSSPLLVTLGEPIGSQCFHSNWNPSEWKPERLERGTKDPPKLQWQVLPPGLAVPTARNQWALRGSQQLRLQLQPREATRAP